MAPQKRISSVVNLKATHLDVALVSRTSGPGDAREVNWESRGQLCSHVPGHVP